MPTSPGVLGALRTIPWRSTKPASPTPIAAGTVAARSISAVTACTIMPTASSESARDGSSSRSSTIG